jgi:integrase
MRQRSAGSWELRVFAGVDPDTGRRRYRSTTVRGSRADANGSWRRWSPPSVPRATSVCGHRSPNWLEAWFATAATTWAPTTVRQTRSVLDRYLHPHLGRIAIGDLTTADIDAAYAQLRRAGGRRGTPLGDGTLARVHMVLRAALAQAVRWGWTWDNPAERAHRIVTTPPELQPPAPDEVRVLLDHLQVHDPALHTFVVRAAFTGAWRAQLLGLRWRNVSFDSGRVAFTAGWV